MISKPNFATVLTFCGLNKPCVDIAVHKQDQSSKNDIKFWPKSVSTCWVNHSRGSIVTTGTANWDTLDEDAMGEQKGGHVVMIRDDDDDGNRDDNSCHWVLLYVKYFAENFTYIISLNLWSDNGKNR